MGSRRQARMTRIHIPSAGFIDELSYLLPSTDCELEKFVLRFLVISTALSIVLLAAIISILGPGETWAYFSGTADELFAVTTGFWTASQPGTSLTAEKIAQGFYEDVGGRKLHGVRGQVCVTNPGAFPTQNLSIEDRVQVKLRFSQFSDYVIFPVDVSLKPVLAPGESFCYPYGAVFLSVPGASYRNTARVTITNHAGWLPGSRNCPGLEPCQFGPNPKTGFTLPDSPIEIRVPDNPAPPRLRGQTPIVAGTLEPTEAATAKATAEATAVASPVPQPEGSPTPTATFTAITPGSPNPPGNLRATPTPAPTLKPESVCVYSADYWKDHPQEWPASVLYLGKDTFSRQQALELLAIDPGEDVTLLVARQLIAGKLNQANAAYGETIETLLVESDAWLEEHPLFSNPKEQARKQGKILASQLEVYNTGESGPEACPLDAVTPTSAPTLGLTGTPSATTTLIPTSTWTPTLILESPSATPSPTPTETLQPASPTPLPTDTEVPDSPTPTLAPTEEAQPTEPPPLVTEEPAPLPW